MRSFASELAALEADALRRRLRSFPGPVGTRTTDADGRALLDFASNDYLGFAASEVLRNALAEAVARHGAGAGASRLVTGTRGPHARLEDALAAFKKTEAALAFSSGYAAAVGTLTAIARRGDVLILDKLCHASLIDGARLSGATLRVFPHNDLARLESQLHWARRTAPADARIVVVTESVFSMDGDWAELPEIVRLKDAHGALLLVDEAHAFGIMGAGGRGLAHKLGLAARVDIHMGTLSKAAGLHGGFVCGSRAFVDLLVNRARSFIYSTAPPPAVAAAAADVVERLLPGELGNTRRARLWQHLARFRDLTGLPDPVSAIVPVILGSEAAALDAARAMEAAGILAPAIRYPTVARGRARLRLTFSAAHRDEDLETLAAALRPVLANAVSAAPADDCPEE